MRIVIAVGGNALQRRGDRLTIENQLAAANGCAPMIKALADKYETVLVHGNGPQVGELALERSAATFDVLGAESQGQIGYIFSQAMASVGKPAACLVTQVVVDPNDAAFQNPTKFVGPIYGAKEAEALAKQLDWTVKPDGEYFRRVVPSPQPLTIVQLDAVKAILAMHPDGPLPIACGGGGVPVFEKPDGTYQGVEAVIDKDNCGALLATELKADAFIILTDGGGVWHNFGKPDAKEMKMASPKYLAGMRNAKMKAFAGSMGPKLNAAIAFVENSPNPDAWAAIGDLKDAELILSNAEGTIIRKDVPGEGVVWRTPA